MEFDIRIEKPELGIEPSERGLDIIEEKPEMDIEEEKLRVNLEDEEMKGGEIEIR